MAEVTKLDQIFVLLDARHDTQHALCFGFLFRQVTNNKWTFAHVFKCSISENWLTFINPQESDPNDTFECANLSAH